jgi:ABC-type polysaccharide/polyol phosphate transport system ATPase subunit
MASPAAAPARSGQSAIECRDVWKQYYFYQHRPRKLKDAIFSMLGGHRQPPSQVWAIQDFNLAVHPGETVGVGDGSNWPPQVYAAWVEPMKT